MDDAEKRPAGCRVAKATKIPPILQTPVMMGAPKVSLGLVEVHPHLMERRLAMAARGMCDLTPDRSFNVLFANWLKLSLALP